MSSNTLWGYFYQATDTAFNAVSSTINKATSAVNSTIQTASYIAKQTYVGLDNLLERVSKAALHLGSQIPAHRDFSNFSQDPKFWEEIFIADLEEVFDKYGSNEEKLLKYIPIWIDASYSGASKVNPSSLILLICNKVNEIEDPTLKNNIFLEIQKHVQLGQIRLICQTQKVSNTEQAVFENRSQGFFQNFSRLLLTGFVFFSLLPQIQGRTTSLREDLQNALVQRNVTLMTNGRFSARLFLQTVNICPPGNQLCEWPDELSSFDCDWNLQKIEFKNIKAVNCTMLARYPLKCLFNGSKFTDSNFEGSTAQNADFSDSEMQNTSFDKSTMQNISMDRVQGNASFRQSDIDNLSGIDLRGIFNFSLSRINKGNFQQNVPTETKGILSLFATYDFTGASVKEGKFQTIYPDTGTEFFNQQPI